MEPNKYYSARPGSSLLRLLEQHVAIIGQMNDTDLCNKFHIEELYDLLQNDAFKSFEELMNSSYVDKYLNVIMYLKDTFEPTSKEENEDDLEYLYILDMLIHYLEKPKKYRSPRPGSSLLRLLEQHVAIIGQLYDEELCWRFHVEELYDLLQNDTFKSFEELMNSSYVDKYLSVITWIKNNCRKTDNNELLNTVDMLISNLKSKPN